MSGSEVPEDVFDLRRIHRLLRLMEKHEVQEIELRQGQVRIRIRRGGPATGIPGGMVPLGGGAGGAVGPSAAEGPPPQKEAKPAEPEYIYIKSPMVGTFYAAPTPDADPYVQPGDIVGPETIVCIIEAMKVFNEIPAEVSGRIVAVLVENGAPVEYGQPLFQVAPVS